MSAPWNRIENTSYVGSSRSHHPGFAWTFRPILQWDSCTWPLSGWKHQLEQSRLQSSVFCRWEALHPSMYELWPKYLHCAKQVKSCRFLDMSGPQSSLQSQACLLSPVESRSLLSHQTYKKHRLKIMQTQSSQNVYVIQTKFWERNWKIRKCVMTRYSTGKHSVNTHYAPWHHV